MSITHPVGCSPIICTDWSNSSAALPRCAASALNLRRGGSTPSWATTEREDHAVARCWPAWRSPLAAACRFWDDGAAIGLPELGYMAHPSLLYDEMSGMENLRYFARLYGINDDSRAPPNDRGRARSRR